MFIEPTTQAITRISEKLDRLRREGWKRHREQLGVDKHQFRSGARARETSLARFERDHAITLPAGYRAFLEQIGEGTGPYYGIMPLARWNEAYNLDDPTPRDYLARPCPLPAAFEPSDDWLERLGCPYEEVWQGTITVAHQGCTFYALLVVTGALRGRVIYMDLDDGPPFVVPDASFLDWYERWLDETLAGLEIFWFGYGPGGSDEALVADSSSRPLPPRARATAVAELGRRKKPAPPITAAILQAVGDEAAEVRAAALRALRHSGLTGVRPGITALADTDSKVRVAAAWLLRKLRDRAAAPALQAALASAASADELFGLGCALSDLDALRVSDFVPFLKDPDERVRTSTAYFLGKTGDREAVGPLLGLLDDPVTAVRLHVVQALGALGDARARSSLEARLPEERDQVVRGNLTRVIGELPRIG